MEYRTIQPALVRGLRSLLCVLLLLLGACGGLGASGEARSSDAAVQGYGYGSGRMAANESVSSPESAPAPQDGMAFADEDVEASYEPAPQGEPVAVAAKALATPDLNQPPPAPPAADSTAPASTESHAPLLIYKADIALASFDVEKGLDAVEAMAKKAGGYLVMRSSSQIVVRVPAAAFDASLKAVLELGDVLRRDLSVDDVTEQFRDLEIRLKNAEAVRVRLEQLLAGAKNTEEALKVEKELGRVTEEVERLKGKLRRLRELIAFSTITVAFSRPAVETINNKFRLPFPWLQELGLSRLLTF